MPIRREYRYFYPIDWPQIAIRFRRAGGRCEVCDRPHGQSVFHLGDGRWWDTAAGSWRDGVGKRIGVAVADEDILGRDRTTRVVLAAAHRDHDTTNNADRTRRPLGCRVSDQARIAFGHDNRPASSRHASQTSNTASILE